MKKQLHILIVLIAASFLITSCGTTNSAYVDDIYYNPKKEARKQAKRDAQIAEMQKNAIIDTTQQDSNEFFFSDYNNYEYTDRLQKFHDDEYDGEFYTEEERNWNMSVNMGFSPYGSLWGVGFGYGFGSYVYNPWYEPYHYYSPYYSSWFSLYSPWGYPYFPYYSPYYGCNYCCNYYPSNPIYPEDDIGYTYGPRYSASTGSTAIGSAPKRLNRIEAGANQSSVTSMQSAGKTEISSPTRITGNTATAASVKNVQNSKINSLTRTTKNTANAVKNNSGLPRSSLSKNDGVENSTNGSALSAVKIRDSRAVRTSSLNSRTNRSSAGNINIGISTETAKVPSYTRTRTEAKRSVPSVSNRNGYTPSYTRTNTSLNRSSYNTSSYTNSRQKARNTYSNTRTSNTSRQSSNPKSSSSSSYSSPSRSSSSSSSRSSYSAPSRNSSSSSKSSYSAPSRSSSSSSSKSSYSAPSRSSSSSSSRSSSSSSHSSGSSSSRSSSSSGHRR